MGDNHDLKAGSFPQPDWSAKDMASFLDSAYQHVVGKAKEAQAWYFQKKNAKRQWGFYLRVVAMVAAAAAGIMPVLSEVFEPVNGKLFPRPGWAAILVAIVALCIFLDKFAGCTSGWVRYVLTGQQIGQHLDEFEFAWRRGKLGLAAAEPTRDEARMLLGVCHEFATKVNDLVAAETKEWAAEFESALMMLEAAAKEIPKTENRGAVDLKVINGEKSEGGWKLQVDDTVQERTGNRAAILSRPGLHIIRATGQIAGKPVSDEKSVKVVAGQTIEVELELKEEK